MTSTDSGSDSERGAFWRFSLDFYAAPGVAGACLALQDRWGKDVNLLLYGIWAGLSGRGRLTDRDFAAAEGAVAPWRREVVDPLRDSRRRVKAEPETGDLYRMLKAAELEAERHAQSLLEEGAPPSGEVPRETRLADAGANLRRYLGAEADASAVEALLQAASEMSG